MLCEVNSQITVFEANSRCCDSCASKRAESVSFTLKEFGSLSTYEPPTTAMISEGTT